MAGFGVEEANRLLDGYTSGTPYTTPDHVWLALFTQDPASSQSETNYPGYARVDVTGKFSPASNGTTSNSTAIFFPECEDDGSYDEVKYVALCKTDTVGDYDSIIAIGRLSVAAYPAYKRSIVFDVGDLSFTLR